MSGDCYLSCTPHRLRKARTTGRRWRLSLRSGAPGGLLILLELDSNLEVVRDHLDVTRTREHAIQVALPELESHRLLVHEIGVKADAEKTSLCRNYAACVRL